ASHSNPSRERALRPPPPVVEAAQAGSGPRAARRAGGSSPRASRALPGAGEFDSAPPVRGQPALERWDTRDMRPAAPAVGSVGEDDPSPLSKSAPLRLSPAQLSRSHQQMRYVLPAMKMPRIRRAKLLICLAILSFQCVRSSQPLDSLRDAAAAAKSGDAGSRQLALAGFHALLVQADFAKAQSLFETAVKRTPPDPYALM